MLLELSDILELSGFIIIKDNELNTIKKPTKTITIIDFYRYSTTILDYIKSSNTDSLALSTLKKRITNLSRSPPTPATNSNTTNNNIALTNKPLKVRDIDGSNKNMIVKSRYGKKVIVETTIREDNVALGYL
ncbi:hypothetical protein PCH_Pc12g12800 [Penicillium rubens Wisconsin 54-1255]|uniref:Uncharacterized protein n=1 Tax=Penicillium rubens (strain ATCC 28089 / DSM 1075 / NRRL 1951 / Wisconsin 54-1255) TaxID=500485 RepID=B6GZ00_PENRW|nr:hypothetical protein PCH_Pc12g12800 [Penicillium rubens Wisconsin 54-1255]